MEYTQVFYVVQICLFEWQNFLVKYFRVWDKGMVVERKFKLYRGFFFVLEGGEIEVYFFLR